MEQECQVRFKTFKLINSFINKFKRLKATLNNLKEAGTAAKNDLNSVSMQAIHVIILKEKVQMNFIFYLE